MKYLIVLVCLVSLALCAEQLGGIRSFDGFEVIRVYATNGMQRSLMGRLAEEEEYDYWTQPSADRGIDIMLRSELKPQFLLYTKAVDIPFEVLIKDVGKLISGQEQENERARMQTNHSQMTWDAYQPYEVISNWLDSLQKGYPNLVTVETIGTSSEGRPLKLIKISRKSFGDNRKKAGIWIDGLFHAREWVSGAAVTYIINELVTNSFQYADILANTDFYIVPVVNPDGYTYSWTTDRMWRGCLGVDPNRNFGYEFGGQGTSSNLCSDIYRGPNAFSEPETRAVRDCILKLKESANLQAYITLHSYSQVWVYPWGFSDELPTDWNDLDTLAKKGTEAIKGEHGTEYTYGSSTNVLYAAAGGSDDWAKSENIKYSYTIELRDTGEYGFLLPPSQILPTSEETWKGIQVVARHVSTLNRKVTKI